MKIVNKNQAIQTVSALLGKTHKIIDIIKYCNLYPALPSWRRWTDYVGNNLVISHNKSSKILLNNPAKRQKIITDLFQKAHPASIASRSRWAFIAFGCFNSEEINSCLIWFLGYDDRFRFTSIINNIWQENKPPLSTGLDILSIVIDNIDLDKKIDIINIEVLGIKIKKAYACTLPLNQSFKIEYQKIGDLNELRG